MTTYILSVGHMNGSGFGGGKQDAWGRLKEIATRLRSDPGAIAAEARRCGAPEKCEQGCCSLIEFAEAYLPANDDGTITFCEGDIAPDGPHIRQLVSGYSGLKPHLRRAFCRPVIREAHEEGIEVNLTVC